MDGKKDIASYIKRVELYFVANFVKKDNEVATLLAVVGAEVYVLVPQQPKDKSFYELKEVLIHYYFPTPILKAERFKFHPCNHLESKLVAQFVVELRE